MKKNLFVMAALAVLAVACAKEQQPSDAPAEAKKTYLHVSLEDTKVSVNSLNGVCSWQAGDVLKAYFRVKNADETFSDVFVDFTCELKDGEAVFATTQEIPAEYERMIITTPAGEFVDGEDDGGKKANLVRNYVYDSDSVPVYARAYSWERLPDGSFSVALGHHGAVLRFVLHDIPAYAAGFVLSNEAKTVVVTTKFPYKTGYSEDIVLHSVFATDHTPHCFYLIDGDGDEIEGTRKTFSETQAVTAGQYIAFDKVVDFKKADLRKDYVKVIGIKWAKGNLVRDYRSAKCHEVQAGVDDGFQTGWGLHDEQWKYINWDSTTDYEYSNDYPGEAYCDVFNWGGIGRSSAFHGGCLIADNKDFNIQAKVYSGYVNDNPDNVPLAESRLNPENLIELEGEARFSADMNSSYNTVYNNQQLAGDVAFWASKGKYCLPSSANLTALSNSASSTASYQYGKYIVEGKTIYGFLYTTPYPKGNIVRSEKEVTFTDADIESGLFLPLVGRRGNTENKKVINRGTLAFYRCANFGDPTNLTHAEWHSKCARGIYLKQATHPVYGFTAFKDGNKDSTSKTDDDGYSGVCHLSAAAGGAIRPILVE